MSTKLFLLLQPASTRWLVRRSRGRSPALSSFAYRLVHTISWPTAIAWLQLSIGLNVYASNATRQLLAYAVLRDSQKHAICQANLIILYAQFVLSDIWCHSHTYTHTSQPTGCAKNKTLCLPITAETGRRQQKWNCHSTNSISSAGASVIRISNQSIYILSNSIYTLI